jgi:hypothetical protein
MAGSLWVDRPSRWGNVVPQPSPGRWTRIRADRAGDDKRIGLADDEGCIVEKGRAFREALPAPVDSLYRKENRLISSAI